VSAGRGPWGESASALVRSVQSPWGQRVGIVFTALGASKKRPIYAAVGLVSVARAPRILAWLEGR